MTSTFYLQTIQILSVALIFYFSFCNPNSWCVCVCVCGVFGGGIQQNIWVVLKTFCLTCLCIFLCILVLIVEHEMVKKSSFLSVCVKCLKNTLREHWDFSAIKDEFFTQLVWMSVSTKRDCFNNFQSMCCGTFKIVRGKFCKYSTWESSYCSMAGSNPTPIRFVLSF